MNTLGKRIQDKRKQLGLSQTELAKKIEISYAQLSRYENKGTQPPAEVLNRFAIVLDTTVDFLINGEKFEKARATLKDSELLRQFHDLEQLDEEDKNVVKKLIDAFITKKKLEQLTQYK